MFDKFFYQEKGLFLQSLHPVAVLIYLGTLLVLALLFTNPLYLLGLLLIIALAIGTTDGLECWESYCKLSLWMMMLIMIINPLMVRAGETIIWYGPHVPVFGRLTISLEAICYGATMSLRLLDVISIFCLYNLMLHPDKVLSLFSRFALRSTLVLSLATRMFPAMIKQLENIREVQISRGVDFNTGNIKERMQKYASLINILLLSSLEDSLETAEAMQARAFGSGRRSCYRRYLFRPRDILFVGSSLLALGVTIYGQVSGWSAFTFYPQLGYLIKGTMTLLILIITLFTLSLPLILSWGWQRCLYFKSKI